MGKEGIEDSIFEVDIDTKRTRDIKRKKLQELGLLEKQDFQKWIIKNPELLGEELLIIAEEYSSFEDVRKQPDIVALDRNGRLVVIELKRDTADDTTDLQAVKYAGYCSVLTAEQIQEDYREFISENNGGPSREEVGRMFADHLGLDHEEGWANFDLDNKPRILLAAGSFPTEVTAPVMWLREEYGLDITCVKFYAYEYCDAILLNARQVIPLPEAEEYMTQWRKKKRQQEESSSSGRTVIKLLNRGVLQEGDIVEFNKKHQPDGDWEDRDEEFWKAKVTGERGYNNFVWLHDEGEYTASRMTQELLEELTGTPQTSKRGVRYWRHPQYENRTLLELSESGADESDRQTTQN